eukprot:6135837-Amphidinium_carterae.1
METTAEEVLPQAVGPTGPVEDIPPTQADSPPPTPAAVASVPASASTASSPAIAVTPAQLQPSVPEQTQ